MYTVQPDSKTPHPFRIFFQWATNQKKNKKNYTYVDDDLQLAYVLHFGVQQLPDRLLLILLFLAQLRRRRADDARPVRLDVEHGAVVLHGAHHQQVGHRRQVAAAAVGVELLHEIVVFLLLAL